MISVDSLLTLLILLSVCTILFCIFGAVFNIFSAKVLDRLDGVLLYALWIYGLSVALYCVYYFK